MTKTGSPGLFKFGLTILVLSCWSSFTYAQQFGGNPPSVKWQQVNTSTSRIIFAQGIDSTAFRVAQVIDRINAITLPTLGNKQKKVNIVLHGRTTISNAYVGLAPFRSEFYLTPDQNSFEIGSLGWADQLAIHEFRHVQQYNNFNVGLSKALSILFGQGGQAIANNIAIPDWFFEGDAVFNETLVSQQGRGRMPYFFNGFRALWNAGKDYSWMKLRNGSYRDYVPNWYPLGYMQVAYGREKYGDELWAKTTRDAASFKGLFYPMQRAIKKHSGIDFTTFRTNALDHFKQYYVNDKKDDHYKKNQHFIANIEYPTFVDDSTLVYMKTTYDDLPQFTLNRGGKEKRISVRSRSLDDYFDYKNGKIVYAAFDPNIRWGFRDYSELRILDINSGREERLTNNTRYFAPAFNADRNRIVTVEVMNGKSQLHIVSAESGNVVAKLPNKDNLFYTYPKYYGDDKIISPVRNGDGKMALLLVNISTGEEKYILPFGPQPIVFPVVNGDMVYFSATSGNNDRLFAVSLINGQLFEVDKANTSLSRYEPALSYSKIAWVEFTAYGYKLQQANRDMVKLTEVASIPGGLADFNISALNRPPLNTILEKVEEKPLPVTKYSKVKGLFNFHSLIPEISDPNYSIALVGENVLNTFHTDVNFTYNNNEGYKKFGVNGVYGGLYPYIRIGADHTLDRRSYYRGNFIYYDETDVHGGLQVPFNLSQGKNITALSVGSDVYYTKSTIQDPFRKQFKDREYTYLNSYITFSNYIQQARKNIYPRFGQSIGINYKNAINNIKATQFLITGTLFLPGMLVNHNLVINAAHQEKGNDNVINFSNNFPFARGYTAENLRTLDKIGVNYHFPIAYPDAGVANTLYFMRIRGNVFYDHTYATDTYTNGQPFRADFRSAGAEIYFDTKWFNQQPLTFGIRYSRLLDNDFFGGSGPDRIEVVLPVSFF